MCRRLLAWGAARWRRLFVTRAAVRPAEPVRAPEGTRWRSHAQRPTMYDSGLGNVLVVRHACTAPGHPGDCPLAAELRVPARGSSDLLCAWGA